MWVIYKHTLLVGDQAGWSYIGQTLQKPEYRFNSGNGYKKCPVFYEAIIANGGLEAWDTAWRHEILADNIKTQNEANKLEKYYIKLFKTYIYNSDCHGYNMTPGGQGQVIRIKIYKFDTLESKFIVADELAQYEQFGWVFPRTKAERNKAYNMWFKTYYMLNKEKQKLKSKKHYEKHKQAIIARTTKNNKSEKAKQTQKLWYEVHKAELKLKSAEYYKQNRDKIIKRASEYQKTHKK